MTLFIALILDALLGEPKAIWDRVTHPAILMGRLIDWADNRFNKGASRKLMGALTLAALVFGTALLGAILTALPFGGFIEIIIVAILVAQKSLVDHVRAVSRGLGYSLSEGRSAVAMIVGRDTKQMSEAEVSRAAIESGAENFSDGIVAPVFWFLIAGLPGILVYKIVNTADSMIGYKTPRHLEFGWASARFDDLLNWAPARLTALIFMVFLISKGGTREAWRAQWSIIAREARLHRSPNAGWPEAAIAPLLGVALAGPRSYNGAIETHPWVNGAGRKEANMHDIEAAIRILWQAWSVLVIAALVSIVL